MGNVYPLKQLLTVKKYSLSAPLELYRELYGEYTY